MTDLTRKGKFAEKKTRSVASARIEHTDAAGTENLDLFTLPENAVIVDAFVIVEVAGQTGLTVDFGYDGGNELGNDIDIDDTTGAVKPVKSATTVPLQLLTGTGKNVTAKFSADPTAGRFVFVVEFIEYDLGNGMLMNYKP